VLVVSACALLRLTLTRASPTYINGPFGRRPLLLSTDEAATEAECMTLAQNKLREVLGTDQELTITAVPMPALVPGDRVRILDGVGVDATFQVSALTIPLDFCDADDRSSEDGQCHEPPPCTNSRNRATGTARRDAYRDGC
jgi:hypothetical protein